MSSIPHAHLDQPIDDPFTDPDGVDDHIDHDHDSERLPLSRLIANLSAVIIPFLAAIAVAVWAWGWGFDGVQLAIFGLMYIVSAGGITVGFHRQYTHKSFDTKPWVRWLLGVAGSMAVEGPVHRWAATHREHHQHSDHDGDPHSPHLHGEGTKAMLKGLWHAHVGWLFEADTPDLDKYIPDLKKDPISNHVSRNFIWWVAIGLLIPTVLGGLLTMSWTGALLGLLWGGLARVFIVHHVTWSINSVCHIWGSRDYRSHDESRNNVIFGILGIGEGWHNNHHAFPTSARHGLKWWQIDFSYYFICTLKWVGLAWNVKVPTKERMQSKLNKPAPTAG